MATQEFTCPYCYKEFEAVEYDNGECPQCHEKYEWGWDGDYGEDSVWTINWLRTYKQISGKVFTQEEDHGITPDIMSKCHQLVNLPGENSLNVSVAGSIVLYDRISRIKLI